MYVPSSYNSSSGSLHNIIIKANLGGLPSTVGTFTSLIAFDLLRFSQEPCIAASYPSLLSTSLSPFTM